MVISVLCVDVTIETFRPRFWKELFKDLKSSSVISLDKCHLQMAALCLKPSDQLDGEIDVKLYAHSELYFCVYV